MSSIQAARLWGKLFYFQSSWQHTIFSALFVLSLSAAPAAQAQDEDQSVESESDTDTDQSRYDFFDTLQIAPNSEDENENSDSEVGVANPEQYIGLSDNVESPSSETSADSDRSGGSENLDSSSKPSDGSLPTNMDIILLPEDEEVQDKVRVEDLPGLPELFSDRANMRNEGSSRNLAVFRGLDKITARVSLVEGALNEPTAFGRLEVVVRECSKKPPEETPNTTAFVEITENTLDGERLPVFTGWLFASSPGLNAVEHPVYDVWLIDCKISEGSASLDIDINAADDAASE